MIDKTTPTGACAVTIMNKVRHVEPEKWCQMCIFSPAVRGGGSFKKGF